MVKIIIIVIIFLLFFFGLEATKRKLKLNPAYTRKIAHFVSAFFTAFFYFFVNKNEFIISCLIFAIFFIISYRHKGLKSIHLTDYKTIGEISYPIALILLASFYFENTFIMISSLAIMGISDSIAGVYNIKYKKKTLLGALLFFILTLFILLISSFVFHILTISIIIYLLLICIILTITEYYSRHGIDNLTVPMIAAFLLSFLF
ncbi:MAG: hypothetical protein Q7T79_01450 [bacterium]|nr:hypothetical protein [bacterium]